MATFREGESPHWDYRMHSGGAGSTTPICCRCIGHDYCAPVRSEKVAYKPEVSEGGAVSIVGPDQVDRFRLKMLKMGLEAELRGRRLTRGQSAYAIIKQEFGLKGNKQKVYDQFVALINRILSGEDPYSGPGRRSSRNPGKDAIDWWAVRESYPPIPVSGGIPDPGLIYPTEDRSVLGTRRGEFMDLDLPKVRAEMQELQDAGQYDYIDPDVQPWRDPLYPNPEERPYRNNPDYTQMPEDLGRAVVV